VTTVSSFDAWKYSLGVMMQASTGVASSLMRDENSSDGVTLKIRFTAGGAGASGAASPVSDASGATLFW